MVKVDQHQKEIKVVEQEQRVHPLELILQELLIVLMEHQKNMLVVVVQDKVVQVQFLQEQTVGLAEHLKVLLVVLE